jgi:hypothetical protein
MRSDQYNDLRDEMTNTAARLAAGANNAEARFQRASDAGAALAAEVYEYLREPTATCRLSLEAAYRRFMGQHSGGFATDAQGQNSRPA